MNIPGYTTLFKNILYPIYNSLIGRPVYSTARERIASQHLSREQLQEIQFRKLKAVLINAQENVPFYREKFAALKFDARLLNSMKEFDKLDFYVSKADVKSYPRAFISELADEKKLTWHRTGGSTGEPLHFPTDPATNSASASAIVRALSWWNIDLGERHAMFWGSPQFIIRKPSDHLKRIANIVRNKFMNRLFISNYNLNDDNIKKYKTQLESFEPSYVRGMPSSLYVFAKSILKQSGPLQAKSLKVVHSACEQLFDWQKKTIEEGFGVPLLNTYGLSEVADIAYEAPCGNLHIMDEDVLVELKLFSMGQPEIVTTQLNSTMAPLIRYRTSDLAESVHQCSKCDMGLQVLSGLKGRAHDFIVAPDGRFLHGQLFTHLMVFEEGIDNYQLLQKSKDKLQISLVVNDTYDASAETRLTSAIKSYMGDVDVVFAYVTAIPLTISGKHRWIISELVTDIV